ncbi:MAG: hypothetical protein KDJ38_05470 [Gammaproteobacteria bacterium]|nr:hypothetical protein [Gammaproteobacteria bacterium]
MDLLRTDEKYPGQSTRFVKTREDCPPDRLRIVKNMIELKNFHKLPIQGNTDVIPDNPRPSGLLPGKSSESGSVSNL